MIVFQRGGQNEVKRETGIAMMFVRVTETEKTEKEDSLKSADV